MTDIKPGYTRVSTILSSIPSMLEKNEDKIHWGFPLQHIPEEVLHKKTLIGTHVHEAIHSHFIGEFFPLDDCSKGYFESFLKWAAFVNCKVMHSEMRLYDDTMKITGAIDMVGTLKTNKSLFLIDFKTSASADLKKWKLQSIFYHHLLHVNGIEIEQPILFVQLNKNGEPPKAHPFFIGKEEKTLMISAYNVYKFLTDK